MVELLATFGVAAKELFDYNREMYQFDQGQRIDRELLRMEMQIKRFELFREDIRDLVELTVGKMEMYHVVGALVLECTVIYYTEGRIRTTAPPWVLALYWLSAAGTFTYVLLCVWFSMYASISSHSFGVRLLTRFVRLPIPGSRQLNALNARLTDFERQDVTDMMRVPFIQNAQQWQQRGKDAGDARPAIGIGQGEGDERFKTAVGGAGELRQQDLLGSGVQAYGDGEDLQQAAVNLPGKHIKLFRDLQAKWQCYDAYARVSMSMGVNHICMTASYYVIGLTAIEYRSPSVMFALVTVFQATNLALAWLDVAGLSRATISSLELFGAIPPFLACWSIVVVPYADDGRGQMLPTDKFPFAWVAFVLAALWLEGLLWLAYPSRDLAMLPKRFRTVLFLDVFGLADDAVKGVESKTSTAVERDAELHSMPSAAISPAEAEEADTALWTAEAAMRRWEELPEGTYEVTTRQEELKKLRRQLTVSRKVLNGEAAKRARAVGDTDALDLLEVDTRAWSQLTQEEQDDDPFKGALLGPFDQGGEQTYYYDIESRQFSWAPEAGRKALTLSQTSDLVQEAEHKVQSLFARHGLSAEDYSDSEGHLRSTDGSDAEDAPRSWWRILLCRKRHDQAYREHRLPWRVLVSVTRMNQIAWLGLGIVFGLEETGAIQMFDKIVIRGEEASEERRLQGSGWAFEPLDVRGLPWGAAEGVACTGGGQLPLLSNSSEGFETATGGVFVVSSGGSYVWGALKAPGQTLELEPVPRPSLRRAPALAATAICAPEGVRMPCLLATIVEGAAQSSLELLKLSDNDFVQQKVSLSSLGSRPWRRIAGSLLRCSDVKDHLDGIEEAAEVEWCLLLAVWDGHRLPVAVMPLADNLDEFALHPLFDVLANKQEVASNFSCEAAPASAAREVTSLGLEASSGKLWVLWSSGELEAFDVLRGQPSGSWRPDWPSPPVSLCARSRAELPGPGADGPWTPELLVLGRSNTSQPELVRAVLQT